MSLLKRWQETSWYSTLGAKVAVALLATAAAVLVSASTSSAQTPTFTPSPTATPTLTGAQATGTAVAGTQTALALPGTQTAIAATQTALVPTLTPTNTPTNTTTRTNTPTPNATQTAAALLTQAALSAPPPISGTATPPVPCAPQVGQGCTISSAVPGGPTGAAGKISSFTFNVTATAPAGSVANQNPIIFVSTTIGVETQANNTTFTCSAVSAGGQTVCQGRTNGDILQGAEFRVRFITPGITSACVGSPVVTPANFSDLCGNAFGPGVAGGVVGAIVPVAPPVGGGLGAGGLPAAVPQVGIPAVPRPPVQFIPPAPAPLLPPQAPIGALQGAMAGAPPRYPEVPVIPETDSLALILGGLAAVGAVALYRRRRT